MLGPGSLIIYLYKPDLFTSIETMKLIIMSFAISIPGVIVPMIFNFIASPIIKNICGEDVSIGSIKEWFYKHTFGNAMNLYILILLGYLFDYGFKFFSIAYATLIMISFIFEIIYFVKVIKDPEKRVEIEMP